MRTFYYHKGQADEMVFYARPNREVVNPETGEKTIFEDPIIPRLLEQGYVEEIEEPVLDTKKAK